MLAGALSCLPVYGAVSGSPADDISRAYPEVQHVPTSTDEVADAVQAMDAGLGTLEAVGHQPQPYRDYTVFLSDLWGLLFNESFTLTSSAMVFDSWIPDGQGAVPGETTGGTALTASIILTIETPLTEDLGISAQEITDLGLLDTTFGIAWAEVSTGLSTARLFGWWLEMTCTEETSAVFVPVSVVSETDCNSLVFSAPYIVENIDTIWSEGDGINEPQPRAGAWSNFRSNFRSKLRSAARVAAVAVGVGVVAAVVVAAAPFVVAAALGTTVTAAAAATVAAGAATSVVAGAAVAAVIFDDKVGTAIDELRDQLQDDLPPPLDISGLTDEQVVDLAEQFYR